MARRFRALAVVTVLCGGGLAALVPAAEAHAGFSARASYKWPCPTTATVKSVRDVTTDHSGTVTAYNANSPSGAPLKTKTLTYRGFYSSQGVRVVLAFGRAKYVLDKDAIFALGCSGKAVGDPAKYPNLLLMQGHAIVSDPAGGYSGSVGTFEALVGPVNGDSRYIKFSTTRTLTQKTAPSLIDMMKWWHDFIDQPKGTTVGKTMSTPEVNITPYVGADPGRCRHCHSSTLTSTGTRDLKPTGTATYG